MSSDPAEGRCLRFLDISRAHPHCEIKRVVYIRLPEEDPRSSEEGVCGTLLMALYGTRDAGQNFELTTTEILQQGGCQQSAFSPCVYAHVEKRLGLFHHGDDFVIDTSGIGSLFGLDFTTPVAVTYGDHPVTRKHRGMMTFFQLGRSVRFAETTGLEGASLVSTSEAGWAETDLGVLSSQGDHTVKLDDGIDQPGPVNLAVAVHDPAAGGRPCFRTPRHHLLHTSRLDRLALEPTCAHFPFEPGVWLGRDSFPEYPRRGRPGLWLGRDRFPE